MSDHYVTCPVRHGGECDCPVSDGLRADPQEGTIARSLVQERYDAAALTVSRLNAPDDDGLYDLDLLPYYEGKRDALRGLLEPLEPGAVLVGDRQGQAGSGDDGNRRPCGGES